MKITVKEVPYVSGKRKFAVMIKGKRYTCYIHTFMGKGFSVFTGDGNSPDCKDITDTDLAWEIRKACRDK